MSTAPTSPSEPNPGTVAPPRPLVVNAPRRPPTAGRAIFASPPPHLAAAAASPTMKITVEVMPALDAMIDNMAETLGETKGTTILRAIALLKTALDAEKEGERLGIVNDAENSERDLKF
jgi:hypothetical protein